MDDALAGHNFCGYEGRCFDTILYEEQTPTRRISFPRRFDKLVKTITVDEWAYLAKFGDTSDESSLRRDLRVLRNRNSAYRSRAKKNKEMYDLKEINREMSKEVHELRAVNFSLATRLKEAERIIRVHPIV